MQVFLGIGSNIEAQKHLDLAIKQLTEIYGEMNKSRRYRTAAIGFKGPDFINMVVAFKTNQNIAEITIECQAIERSVGRIREEESGTGSRAIDIDLLLFQRINSKEILPEPRSDICEYAYAAMPLADLIPDWRHQLLGDLTLAEYVQQHSFEGQSINCID